MRTAPLLALAGALFLIASCSSSDDNGGASKVPSGVVTSASDAGSGSADTRATTAGSTGSSAPTSDSTAPTPTSLPDDPAAAVKAFYGLGGGTLTDQEAACVAGSTGDIVDTLNEALTGGVLDPATGKALLKAFATCEPGSYVDQTAQSIVSQSGATKDQATCVLHAVDKLFVADDAVLTQASGNGAISEWPAAEHDKFSAAVKTCVPDDLATKIVDA